MAPRVVITGATSFTGYWICRAFREAGWDVQALCLEENRPYPGVLGERLRRLSAIVPVHYGLSAEKGDLEKWIASHSIDVWVHHHHHMANFRLDSYDFEQALKVGVAPIPGTVQALKKAGCKGIIFTGSYFEPGEGGQPLDVQCTPYSRSKRVVWEALSTEAKRAQLPLSKIVLPNPVGPLENDDRLIPVLFQKAKSGQPLSLRTPNAISDQLPIRALAGRYVTVANDLYQFERAKIERPSGYVGSVLDWIQMINQEVFIKRLKMGACALELPTSAPTNAHGFSNPKEERIDVNWSAFWDEYAEYFRQS